MLFWVISIPLFLVLQPALTALLLRWEKRLLWPYVSMTPWLDPTPYMVAAAASAQATGLVRLGVWRDGRGRVYSVRYEFWLPPERDALVMIAGGRMKTTHIDATCVFTRLGDGRYLVTIDNFLATDYDLAGIREEALYQGAGLHDLLDRHRQRVGAAQGLALPFSKDPTADYRDVMARRVEVLAQRGYAYFADRERGVWRYTNEGAVRLSLGMHWTLLRRIARRAS